MSPTGATHPDIQFLEAMLIGTALRRNPEVLNVSGTKLLKEMTVPGLINSPRGKPSAAVVEFKTLFDL